MTVPFTISVTVPFTYEQALWGLWELTTGANADPSPFAADHALMLRLMADAVEQAVAETESRREAAQ